MRAPHAAAALLLLLSLTACKSSATSATPAPFADCSGVPVGASGPLPSIKLPCFTGGAQVDLATLRGPAMINLWASWCGPCRGELPVIQRLADQNPGKITVLTVDTGDVREKGGSFASDVGVRLPTLFDADKKLLTQLKANLLPLTVFIDAAGKQTVYRLPLSDPAKLQDQVRAATGVRVTVTK